MRIGGQAPLRPPGLRPRSGACPASLGRISSGAWLARCLRQLPGPFGRSGCWASKAGMALGSWLGLRQGGYWPSARRKPWQGLRQGGHTPWLGLRQGGARPWQGLRQGGTYGLRPMVLRRATLKGGVCLAEPPEALSGPSGPPEEPTAASPPSADALAVHA